MFLRPLFCFKDTKHSGLLIFNPLKQKKLIFNFFVNRNWKKITDSLQRAKILADNHKSHHPIETLLYGGLIWRPTVRRREDWKLESILCSKMSPRWLPVLLCRATSPFWRSPFWPNFSVLGDKMQYLRRDKKDEEDGKKFIFIFLSFLRE